MRFFKRPILSTMLWWIVGLAVLGYGYGLFNMQDMESADSFGLIMMLMILGLLLGTLEILRVLELPRFINKIWVIGGFCVMPYIMVHLIQILSGTDAGEMSSNIFAWNYFWCLIVYGLCFVATNHYRASLALGTAILYIVGATNYFVLDFRGTPFQITDILSVGTAADVVGSYPVAMDGLLLQTGVIAFFAVSVACIGYYYQCRILCLNAMSFAGSIAVLVACLWGMGVFYSEQNWIDNNLSVNFWNPAAGYEENGTALSLAMSAKYLRAEKPENYNVATVEAIVLNDMGNHVKMSGNWPENTSSSAAKFVIRKQETAKNKISSSKVDKKTNNKPDSNSDENSDKILAGTIEKNQETVKPNIIAIMNESYADLGILGNLKTRIPYMTFMDSLQDNTIKGNLTVSVLGGGTCNTEFEYLTGASMAFLPSGVMAYQQYITGQTESLASILKAQGYETVAFHPGKEESWRRNKVYPYLGFDAFLTEKDMEAPEYMRGAYVSDSSDYKEIIHIFEEKEADEKLFLFNVTIQNHGGYRLDTVGIPKWVSITNLNGHYPETEEYLSLMQASDQALKELISYFRKAKEPTIIVFFGDHQPSVEPELVEELMQKSNADLNLQEVMQRYKVPFFIWANYDIEEDYYDSIGANYLAALTLQTAGLEMSPYMEYLVRLQQQIPMIAGLCYQDTDLQYHRFGDNSEAQKLVDEYRMVQYNYLFGGRNRVNSLYQLPTAEKSLSTDKTAE